MSKANVASESVQAASKCLATSLHGCKPGHPATAGRMWYDEVWNWRAHKLEQVLCQDIDLANKLPLWHDGHDCQHPCSGVEPASDPGMFPLLLSSIPVWNLPEFDVNVELLMFS